jgi:uncharacterized protein (DUF433 family)
VNESDLKSIIGLGAYTFPEASRLLRLPKTTVRRWMLGYKHSGGKVGVVMPPLWRSDYTPVGLDNEISFRDLIELKFVHEFLKSGISLQTIRLCLEEAKRVIDVDYPFLTRRFKTDGKTIFVEGARESGDKKLLDLKRKQYAFNDVIEQSFKDLDIEDDAVSRWRPFKGKTSIVIDPQRSFGQPISSEFGVPTVVLSDAVRSEGTVARVARLYEVAPSVVRDAVAFQRRLEAA